MLGFWDAVGDDARAGLIAVFVAPEHERTNGDRVIHIAAGAEVSHGASVEAATHRLQLINDLHRAHLRNTDQKTNKKNNNKKNKHNAPKSEHAKNTTDDVH